MKTCREVYPYTRNRKQYSSIVGLRNTRSGVPDIVREGADEESIIGCAESLTLELPSFASCYLYRDKQIVVSLSLVSSSPFAQQPLSIASHPLSPSLPPRFARLPDNRNLLLYKQREKS
jgi:hypothetical protein